MKTIVKCLSLLLLVVCGSVDSSQDSISRETYQSLLESVMTALERIVQFFEASVTEVNMDGLYCVRLCQGSLIGTLKDCARYNSKCEQKLLDTLQDSIDRLQQFGEQAMPNIKAQDEDYYNTFLPAFNSSFEVKYILERLDGATEVVDNLAAYDGLKGNECFGDVMGTRIVNGKNVPTCTITDNCWNFMSKPGTIGYFTTHQLLYCIYGEHSGCENQLEYHTQKSLGVSLRQFEKNLCEQIFLDAKIREQYGRVEIHSEDLFMEQIALCGVLGFEDFFDLSWMRMILSWQTERGCFSIPSPFIDNEDAIERNGYETHRLSQKLTTENDTLSQEDKKAIVQRLLELRLERSKIVAVSSAQNLAYSLVTGHFASRKLMSELVMGGDCLAHKSGLGATDLGVYVRYLVGKLYGN